MSSVTMNHGVFLTATLLHLLLLHNSVTCVCQWPCLSSPPPPPPLQVAGEEKIRLGSTPPSCRNRCNACDPCKAVQIPTTSGQTSLLTVAGRRLPDQLAYSQYHSNYKPLGWRCSCGTRLFNP